MDERDIVAVEPGSRLRVDHVDPRRSPLAYSCGDVGDLVRDVVHPRAAFGEEAPDGGVLRKGAHELDPARPHAQVRSLDALVLHASAQLELSADEALARADGLVELLDGKRDVMDGADVHAPILSAGVPSETRPARRRGAFRRVPTHPTPPGRRPEARRARGA